MKTKVLFLFLFISFMFFSYSYTIHDMNNYIEENENFIINQLKLIKEDINSELATYLKSQNWNEIDEVYELQDDEKNIFKSFSNGNSYLLNQNADENYFIPSKTEDEFKTAIFYLENKGLIDSVDSIIIPFDNLDLYKAMLIDSGEDPSLYDDLLMGRVVLKGQNQDDEVINEWEFEKYCTGAINNGVAFNDNFECYECVTGLTKSKCIGKTRKYYNCEDGFWVFDHKKSYDCSGCENKHKECDTCYDNWDTEHDYGYDCNCEYVC